MSNFISRWWNGGCLNKFIFIGLIVLLAGMSIIWIGQGFSASEVAQTWNKVKPGDSLYVDSFAVVRPKFVLPLHRLVRPINKTDIEKLKIAGWKKNQLVDALDTSQKKIGLIESKYGTSRDKMYQQGTSFVGTYISRDSTYQPLSDKVEVSNDYHWYIVKLNEKILDGDYKVDMPKGYTYADSNYYIETEMSRLQEAPAFNKKHKSLKKH